MLIKTNTIKHFFISFLLFSCQYLIGQNDTIPGTTDQSVKTLEEAKPVNSDYTDTIVMNNGDKFLGDIKELNNGVLTVETDYSDSDFKLKWVHISSIESNQYYLITLANGVRINSNLRTTGEKGTVELKDDNRTITALIKDIVFLKAVETSFFSRLSASVSFGYSYAKSNKLSQLTVRSSLGYISSKWGFNASYNSVRSNQEGVSETQRTDASVGGKYFLRHDWYVLLNGDFLSNEEQLLELRTTIKSGLGKYLIHSNKVYFSAGAGLAWNNERYSEAVNPNRNSLEAFMGMEINMFDFDDISLLSNIVAYPSLTESGRFRTDFSIDLSYDLPLDFFVKVGLTYNFDNQPVENASEVDYVFQTTFGWEL